MNSFIEQLEAGIIRVAQKVDGQWIVYPEVKSQILQLFRDNPIVEMKGIWEGYLDKAPLTPRKFTLKDGVRVVPGGTSIRAGAYVGQKTVIMPPSYINIGAYVDDETMVDSHVLVGSCAQIGKRVHLSTAVQIGGVLEPVGHRPVIIEDDCFLGAGVVITEGVLVKAGAVLAPGVKLTASVPIYDVVNQQTFKNEVPENAVVIPGTRPITSNDWAISQGLAINCAIIVKYRDQKTDHTLVLESLLR